jgi:hypothetical protein
MMNCNEDIPTYSLLRSKTLYTIVVMAVIGADTPSCQFFPPRILPFLSFFGCDGFAISPIERHEYHGVN